MEYDIGNSGPGLGQKCDGINSNTHPFDNINMFNFQLVC